jgi:two-component system nitrogen regulation response regulator GlnG
MAAEASPKKVLIVDDEPHIREMLQSFFETKGYGTRSAEGATEAFALIEAEPPHLVVLDIRMEGMDGLTMLQRIKRRDKGIPVVMMTGYGTVDSAVTAMKLGAEDYVSKPVKLAELLRIVEQVLGSRDAEDEAPEDLSTPRVQAPLTELMGHSAAIRQVCALVEQVAQTDLTVLIYGETGTGKSLVASAIHAASLRGAHRSVRVDCGAIPDTLIESELFGHERGAFTGAEARHVGYFELANHGTLFLDEVANLSEAMMRKLLCALEDRQVYRVGGKEPVDVDIRVVAASNRDLDQLVAEGSFRRDLYHRINEFVIHIPPLRRRKEDVPFLVQRFVGLANAELGKDVHGASSAALEVLDAHDWPGNVRELRNVVKRAVLVCNDAVEPEHLRAANLGRTEARPPDAAAPNVDRLLGEGWSLTKVTRECVRQIEERIISAVLDRTGGNKSQAARLLNVDYKTLFYKAKELGY